MPRFGFVLSAAAALAAALVLVPASSATAWPLSAPAQLDSAHFRIFYSTDQSDPAFFTQTKAGDVLGWAERAYSTYQGMGFATPIDDTDGKLDISVVSFDALGSPYLGNDADAEATDRTAGTTSGSIALDVTRGTNLHTVAHEVFHLFEWATSSNADLWLEQASAEWAAYRVDQAATSATASPAAADATLDCVGCGDNPTGVAADDFDNATANPGWSFFEYLAERFGDGFIRTIWAQQAADGALPWTTAVNDALAAKGSSLSDAFNGWIETRLAGSFTLATLKGTKPQVFASTTTGSTSGPLGTQIVNVDHLSARYLAFVPGDGSYDSLCHAATLTLHVTIPSGVPSKPTVFVDGSTSKPQELSVSGQKASIDFPWSDCTGGSPLYLSLPNASTSANGTEFVVSATLTIDPNTIATAVGPPKPVSMPGVVLAAPTTSVTPTLELLGPEVVHVAAKTRILHVVVTSDTDGTVQGSLGSYALGTAAVRTGGNDLRFTLPASALRRTSGLGSNVITLTPLASTGTPGTPVTQLLRVDFPAAAPKPKPTPKAKAKTKPKPAAHKHTTHKG